MRDKLVGERWEEFVTILDRALGELQLKHWEKDFCSVLKTNLELNKGQTVLSTKQVQKINELNGKLP